MISGAPGKIITQSAERKGINAAPDDLSASQLEVSRPRMWSCMACVADMLESVVLKCGLCYTDVSRQALNRRHISFLM